MIKLVAFAKINLLLSVLGKRADGFHEIQTIMQSISLADKLTIEKNGDGDNNVKLMVSGIDCSVSPEENLVYRVAKEFFRKINSVDEGLFIRLEKKIPVGAGLGGGSADCAATLQGLNILYNNILSNKELEDIANKLGSDISFCLYGGTCLCEGKGERITRLPDLPKIAGLILKPSFSIATADVYDRFDEKKQTLTNRGSQISLYRKGDLSVGDLPTDNDLLAVASELKPKLLAAIEVLKSTNPTKLMMSGSGSGLYGLYKDIEKRDIALTRLSGKEVYPFEMVDAGWKLT